MKPSDLVAVPLQLGSAVRGRRVFHPAGVMASGSLDRVAPPGEGLPIESSDVVVRVSKAIGLPGGLPDIIGLALRIPPQAFAATPWDILLASTGSGRLTRFALRPTTSWRTSMTTLMPVKYDGQYWWVRAHMTSEIGENGLSLDRISQLLSDGGIEYELDQARGTDEFAPLANVRITEAWSGGLSSGVAFDPTIHSAPGVTLAPEWLTHIRQRAYERSRRGRS
jgi:hypothetical protein